jgi:DNA-nicking Smr family endonuclease
MAFSPAMSLNTPFDKLKKQLKKAKKAAAAAPAPPPPSPPPESKPSTEEDLFADAMSDVREIEGFRVLPCNRTSKREAPSRSRTGQDDEALQILRQIASGEAPINLSDTQEYIEWTNPEHERGLIEDLHAGRFAVQGTLDLHGATGDEVNEEVDRFVDDALKRGYRCVKIIHGRGLRSVKGPVLKDAVVRRLAGHYRKQVVAFVSARQCDGGLGALYVLLNR